jgi:hypothetical protein
MRKNVPVTVATRTEVLMSSPAQTLGSWVRILLEAWMSLLVSYVFVLSCVGGGLATGLISRQTSPTDCM